MKIKNILALLCFLCIGVSCSMEDDILNNVDMGGVGTNIANTEAVFAFSLSGNSSMTKAGEITENPNDVTSTESSISNCFVAIIKDDNVLSSYWYATSDLQTSSESFTTDIKRHMIVKVPSDKPALTAYAVANLTQTTADKLLACTTIAGIRDVELAEPNFLVKVGEQPIGSYKTTTQLATHDDVNCNKITIPVSQRVAAFELASFKVVDTSKEKVDGEYPVVPNVEVVSVQMLNIKLSAKVVGEYGSSFSGVDDKTKALSVKIVGEYVKGDKKEIATYKLKSTGFHPTWDEDGGWGEGSNTKFIINTEELEMGGTVSKIDITSTGESTDYQYSIPINPEYKADECTDGLIHGNYYHVTGMLKQSTGEFNIWVAPWVGKDVSANFN